MAPHITVYIDLVSTFVYIASEVLTSPPFDGVPLTIVPVFLAAIMQATSNRPPNTVPPKGKYMTMDFYRACRRLQIPVRPELPPKFPVNTLFAQRVLCAVALRCGQEGLRGVTVELERALWRDAKDVEDPAVVAGVVAGVLGEERAREVLADAKGPQAKEALKKNTEEAIAKGCFGLPWMVVTGKDGREETMWGADHLELAAEVVGISWPPVKAQQAQL